MSDHESAPRPSETERPSDTGAETPSSQSSLRQILAFAAVTLIAATTLAIVAALVARWFGGSPKVQRVAAYGGIAIAMLGLLTIPNLRTSDPPALVATLVALSTVIVGALTYIGPIEKTPPLGCINSHGPYSAAAASQPTIVWSQASAASNGRTLLNQGCVFHFSHYCVGHVHKEILEDHFIPESRWIILPDGQGYVPFGYAIGELPSSKEDSAAKRAMCSQHVREPDKLSFTRALLQPKQRLLILSATSPRAAMIGFALKAKTGEKGKWVRIGWDRSPDDHLPVAFETASQVRKGATIIAVSCIGFRAAATPAVQKMRAVEITHEERKIKPQYKTQQPAAETSASAVACNSGEAKASE